MTTNTRLQILVIEDDPDARANLQDILELDDYQVETAGTVAEALARNHWSHFAAILLDRRLPDGSAEELLPTLKRVAPRAAILIVTGYGDVQGAISAFRLGAGDYILKPINADELRARLRYVAKHHRAEEQIRALTSLPAESPSPVLRIASNGTLLYANNASEPLLRLWGCQVGQSLPGSWKSLLQEILNSGLNRDVEVKYGDRSFSLLLAPIPGAGYVNVYGRDMTKRLRAEEELRQAHNFAESLIDTAQAIVLVLDPEGRIVRFNHYLEELSGYRLEDVKGRDWFSTFLPPGETPRIQEVFLRTLTDVSTSGTCNPIVAKDGHQREIQWSNKVLRDRNGKTIGVLAIGHDITTLREAQQRAVQAERLAAIGQMMTALAHESGNALARSQACLEMLRWEVEDKPEALELIVRIQKAQEDLRHLYDEVRNYVASLQLDREVWSLAMIWRQCWDNLALVRQGKEASLQEKTAGVDLDCAVDQFRLGQVFRNILENALAACPSPVRIEIQCADADIGGRPAVCMSVKDNGPGLTPEQKRRIFEPFFTTKKKGTGLGMAIAKRIVEAHGGQIAVGEGEGPGAEIRITLPREPP